MKRDQRFLVLLAFAAAAILAVIGRAPAAQEADPTPGYRHDLFRSVDR